MSEEPEDYNAFGKWDAVGAAAMLGIVPAVFHFIFNDHDIPGTISWAIISPIAAAGVYLLGFVMDGKAVGRIVNLVGMVLTVIYIIIGYFLWREAVERIFPTSLPAQEEAAASAESASTTSQSQ